METKILSIAIPTWNRANTLKKALEILFLQILEYKDLIEIVISDNASTDNTQNVIEEFSKRYPEIVMKTFLQNENTGFYGNFCKVKELSTAKYVWLLSDDDFICNGLIKEVLHVLNRGVGIAFLSDWIVKKDTKLWIEYTSVDFILKKYNYKLTLISSAIFLNNNQNFEEIKEKFHASNFIGFAFLTEVLSLNNSAAIIHGNSLSIGQDTPKGYNWFKAFVIDLAEIINHMRINNISTEIVENFRYSVLSKLILKRYLILKAYGEIDKGLQTWNISIVEKEISKNYINSLKSKFLFEIMRIIPSKFLFLYFEIFKTTKIFAKKLLSFR